MPAAGSIPGRAATCTMAPEPCFRMCGATAWLSHSAGPRLTLIMSCSVSGVVERASQPEGADGVHQHVRGTNLVGDPADEAVHCGGVGRVGHLGADTVGEFTHRVLVPVDRHH